jgi:hypothetical protein
VPRAVEQTEGGHPRMSSSGITGNSGQNRGRPPPKPAMRLVDAGKPGRRLRSCCGDWRDGSISRRPARTGHGTRIARRRGRSAEFGAHLPCAANATRSSTTGCRFACRSGTYGRRFPNPPRASFCRRLLVALGAPASARASGSPGCLGPELRSWGGGVVSTRTFESGGITSGLRPTRASVRRYRTRLHGARSRSAGAPVVGSSVR